MGGISSEEIEHSSLASLQGVLLAILLQRFAVGAGAAA
jgi:hypothetical protein